MAAKRILALLVAVGMIVVALQVRAAREPVAGPDEPSADEEQVTPERDHALVCVPELADVCDDVAAALAEDGWEVEPSVVPVESYLTALSGTGGGTDPGTAATDGPALEPGVWLTIDPLPGLATQRLAATGGGPTIGDPVDLARSPLVAAVWDDRAEVLADACGGALTWRCIGDAAGGLGTWAAIGGPESWGPIKPGHGDPTTSTEGLLILGQIAAGYFGRDDISARDLDDPGFFGWFTDLQRAVPTARPSSGGLLLEMVQFGPGSFDVVGVVEARAVDLLARSAERAGTLTLRMIDPVATADVVAVPVGESSGLEELMRAVAAVAPAQLARNGWRVDGEAASPQLEAAGAGELEMPEGSNLPPAGSLEALRRTWSEVAR